MASVSNEIELIALAADVPAAVRLARLAIVAAYTRSGPAVDAESRIASVTERIHSGEMTEGRVCRLDGRSVGIAFWETGHPRGITLQILYLEPTVARRSAYEAVLSALTSGVGPLVFTPGGLVGLSDADESAMMQALRFARFSRSEMRWPASLAPPPLRESDGIAMRPVLAADEPTVATLHLAAFDGTFDQYMYLSDPDPAIDAARSVREMMTGRYGEFLGWASTIAESEGRPVGASLVIRAMFGPLLISVMVDRESQGRGIGRAMVLANLHALRARGETFAALNVTEGNTRAVQLYERLGFVRSLGPEHSWYSRAAVPVAPGEILRTPSSSPSPGTTGSGANRTPRT